MLLSKAEVSEQQIPTWGVEHVEQISGFLPGRTSRGNVVSHLYQTTEQASGPTERIRPLFPERDDETNSGRIAAIHPFPCSVPGGRDGRRANLLQAHHETEPRAKSREHVSRRSRAAHLDGRVGSGGKPPNV